ncbi:GPI ethanolamine phosphate transferase [Verticillium alfalfae VaMs.102]|uniref:GPI ethanolamine phosphate transferase 2 n=1 Tax=Verticillium alfalfae (strain VaMs.102 / ATCC MYA-4576 / FGSC 10136) TaxID=526221 RepID=C9SUT3_VERA1|nr:GPI ethanolamine phosphate transferase [Verticillium alfalfae VaMs.102]EEY22548.1 GPI ethanolamine phosphate transferase [Verticillium alfalfae VaMs.102]
MGYNNTSRLETLFLVIANLLIPVSIIVFATGFFPYKPFLSGLAQYEALDYGSPPAAPFDRLVFMVVDALRSLIRRGHALPFTANARSPTITMPRIKAITTGSIPSFLDVILNFDEGDTSSTLAAQDTWLAQMKAKKSGKMVMYGDDTWLKLFPDTFDRADGTSSFFVSDFTEVDNNVTRHVPDELRNKDWSTMCFTIWASTISATKLALQSFKHDSPIDSEWVSAISKWLGRAQDLMSNMASNYDMPRLVGGQASIFVALVSNVLLLKVCWSHTPFVIMTISYGIMMFASSFVEEEHHFWYWATSAWFGGLGIVQLRKSVAEPSSAMSMAELLHYLYALLAATQSRVTNIPLLLLFEVQYTFLASLDLDVTTISTTSILLQYMSFFAFGGTNAISSVDLSSAYNGVSGFNVVGVGSLTFISNWAGPVYWTSATNLLLLQRSRGRPDSSVLFRHLTNVTLFATCSVAFIMAACTALRTHLFIWTVFSPKYLYCMAWGIGQHLFINILLASGLYWDGARRS